MKLYPKDFIQLKEIKKFILIFYIVGLLGFLIPQTKDLFIVLIPFALVLAIYLLGIFHSRYDKKTILALIIVFFSGFFIETIGVETGLIFGSYKYGDGLGLKVLETPLVIGLNWAFLTYTSLSIISEFRFPKFITLLLAPLLMVVYDLILEQLAPKMDMWSWENNVIPFQNYIAWYVVSFVFVLGFDFFKVDVKNSLSKILFLAQFSFFAILLLLL